MTLPNYTAILDPEFVELGVEAGRVLWDVRGWFELGRSNAGLLPTREAMEAVWARFRPAVAVVASPEVVQAPEGPPEASEAKEEHHG